MHAFEWVWGDLSWHQIIFFPLVLDFILTPTGMDVTVHGFPVPSSPCLVCVRVRMCEQVSVGVCDLRLIRSSWASLPWAISGPVTLSPLSDPCGVCSVWSVCGRRLRSVPVPRFLSPAASWTPIAGPWLPIASLRYPPQPYGKLRFCLRKAPRLPTEAPPLPYGSSASALRKAPFSSRCVLLLVINSLFRNWILPSSLWQWMHDLE